MADKVLARADQRTFEGLFVSDPKEFGHDLLESLVDMVYEPLAFISNKFVGVNDEFWHTCISTFMHVYPSHGEGHHDGMNPFQQRLALKLIDKLRDNMNGFYPAICTVMLACVGPYKQNASLRIGPRIRF